MKSLWVDFKDLERRGMTYNIITGGRGTGKTYGALKHTYERGERILFIRRTQTEMDMIAGSGNADANPYKAISRDMGIIIEFDRLNKYLYGIFDKTEETPKLIGYAAALSTFSRLRGMDFSDVETIIYDEFIAELHVNKIRGEADAFFNLYESVNRNREFDGGRPVKCWLLSNSNNISTPIFQSLGIVGKVERMAKRNQQFYIDSDRSLMVVRYYNDAFRDKKKQTALYKLTEGTAYSDMALDNNFAYNDFSLVAYRDVTGMIPLCNVTDMYLYCKKDRSLYYVTYAPAKCKLSFGDSTQERVRFRETIGINLLPYFTYSRLWFESYDLKQRWLDMMLASGYRSNA